MTGLDKAIERIQCSIDCSKAIKLQKQFLDILENVLDVLKEEQENESSKNCETCDHSIKDEKFGMIKCQRHSTCVRWHRLIDHYKPKENK